MKEYNPETMTKASVIGAEISAKSSSEICRYLKGKYVNKMIEVLGEVQKKKQAIPFTRHNKKSAGHKPGMAAGKYPIKACAVFIKLLKELEANARDKTMDPNNLVVKMAMTSKGGKQPRYGRERGRLRKNTRVELIAEETESKTKKLRAQKPKAPKKTVATKKVEAPKKEVKPKVETPKVEEKKVEVPKKEEAPKPVETKEEVKEQ